MRNQQWLKTNNQPQKGEEGVALLITMMMGLLLLAGSGGLMARMMMGRKIGSSESYQQMAETAALNGFNRILATFNKDDDKNYRGYYFALNNHEGDPDINGDEKWHWESANERPSPAPLQELCTDTSIGVPAEWPRSNIQITSGNSQRNDGEDDPIQLFYRLRGYSSPGQAATGEGVFEVEGIVKREGASATDDYLARTLLTRSLYVQSIVTSEDDWGVIAGHHLELADSRITDHFDNADGPGMIVINEDESSAYQSTSSCSPSALASRVGSTNTDLGRKVWPTLKRGLPLTSLFEKDQLVDRQDGQTRIWSFDDSNSESIDPDEEPDSDSFHAQCTDSPVCIRLADSDIFSIPNGVEVDSENNTITIDGSSICKGQNGFECHLYVEHLNLDKTKLHIENSSRPVVIHLERPQQDNVNSNLSGRIELAGTSEFCGVNSGSSTCNSKPERFVITANAGQTGMACNAQNHVVSFEGDSLPHAFIHLPKGTVQPTGDAKLHGVIWAHSICAGNGNIQLVTEDSSGTVVQAANNLWQWSDQGFPGYGRMVTRGIRGTGLDTFRRW
jgi:hypothetical protein